MIGSEQAVVSDDLARPDMTRRVWDVTAVIAMSLRTDAGNMAL
jgi:hypothetical protein